MKKNKKLIFLSILILSQVLLGATIYKGLDPQGNVLYSDQPLPNGKPIELAIPQSAQTAPSTADQENSKKDKTPTDYKVHIVEPHNDETFTTDIENIEVKLSIEPELQPAHKIRLFVNAAPYKSPFDTTTIKLERLARGAYQLQAQIVPAEDITHPIAQSDVVMFYQKRATVPKPVTQPVTK